MRTIMPGASAIAADDAPVRLTFVVVADWQISDDNLSRLVECLIVANPDLILISGDLANAQGGDPAPWDAFFDRIQPLLDVGIPLWTVPGNHDFYGDLVGARKQWTDRWDLPHPEFFFSLDAGPAHIVGLCSLCSSDGP